MHLQRRRETHGSVNQAGTLPAPFPIGRSPRWLAGQQVPEPAATSLSLPAPAAGSAHRITRWVGASGASEVGGTGLAGHSQTVKLTSARYI